MVEIVEYKPNEFMVIVSHTEALELIKTMSLQILNNDGNHDRKEFIGRDATEPAYFSISVREKEQNE